MTFKEYMELIPEATITTENEKEFEFVMNEFLRNAYGSCDRDDLEKQLSVGPLEFEGMFDKYFCSNLKELVYANYKYYKNTIDNPYIQNAMPPSYDPLAKIQEEKRRHDFVKQIRKEEEML